MDGFLHDISWVLPLRSDNATAVANAFTWLGYPQFFIGMLPIIYWLVSKEAATRIALLVIFTAVTNGYFKDLFDDPRPPGEIFALDHRTDNSYGMPSGHAQVAFALWLWLALELRQRWFWPIAIFFALGVTLSRLYLGVHDVEDVLTGTALGIGSLFLLRWFFSASFDWWRGMNPAVQLCLILGFQAALWYTWPEPDGPGNKFAVGGMLIGWWMGVLIEQRSIKYVRHPDWFAAIAATILGGLVIFLTLPMIEPVLMAGGLEKLWARWAGYFAVAVFVTAAGPAIFQWLGAAKRAES